MYSKRIHHSRLVLNHLRKVYIMIYKKKLLESLESHRIKPLMEETFSKLYKLSDSKRIDRSKSIIAYYKGLYQDKSDKQAVTTWTVPSASKANTEYTCLIGLNVKGGLFSLAKEKWNPTKFAEAFATADVKVHCNCPDFYWSGMKYNLGPQGHLKGHTFATSSGYKHEKDNVDYAPNVRDPHRQHVMCKHLLSVVTKLHANAFSIMSQAKKMNADPVDGTVETSIDRNKKSGAKKLNKSVNDSKQERVRKAITENFANAVVNLHESGKLDPAPVDPSTIVDIAPVLDKTTDSNGEKNDVSMVDIGDVEVKDTDINSIVSSTSDTDNAGDSPDVKLDDVVSGTDASVDDKEQETNVEFTNDQTKSLLSKDEPRNNDKVNLSEIVGQ